MTAPRADAARLHAVAAWDAPLVRRAVALLAETIDRLLTWRARLEGVGRALEAGDCWSGQAAQSAVAALSDVSAVSSAVAHAFEGSLSAYQRLVTEAARAQDFAAEALAAALLLPDAEAASAFADAALGHAVLAAVAAEGAGDALAGLGVRDAFAPASFQDLLRLVPVMGPFQPPGLPSPRPPAGVAAWWAGLSAAAQRAVIATSPAAVGALDGVPAWARDRANRLLLDRALRDPRTPAAAALTAGVVARRIAAEEAAGKKVQLHLFDLAGDRVVLALGDLDTADAVALLVPGIGNSPGDDLGGLISDARNVAVAARAAAPETTAATVVWLGYRPPSTLASAITRTAAWRGGPALAATLAGLAAARDAIGNGQPRTTVVAHSYGTVVVDEAADVPGTLPADAVVLLGSPGMEDDAASLEAPAIFDAASDGDVVPRLDWFGDRGTREERYGSTGLPVTAAMGHSDYLDRNYPTLAAVGEVVTGRRTPE
jgi:hypothetical protein